MIIKICGIKNVENLLCCEANNVDFYGMILYIDYHDLHPFDNLGDELR